MPNLGDRVHVRPAKGCVVQRGKDLFEQFLHADGAEVLWDTYHEARLADGSLLLSPASYHAQRIESRLVPLRAELLLLKEARQHAKTEEGRAALDQQIEAQQATCKALVDDLAEHRERERSAADKERA